MKMPRGVASARGVADTWVGGFDMDSLHDLPLFSQEQEEWRKIPGYAYEASTAGRIRHAGSPHSHKLPLKLAVNSNGYLRFNCHFNGGYKSLLVHRAVLCAFVGNPPRGFICRHLNGNRADNRLCNLAWGTYAENKADMRLHGTQAEGSGVKIAKLDEQSVRWARTVVPTLGIRAVATTLGVSVSTLRSAVLRLTWRHVED